MIRLHDLIKIIGKDVNRAYSYLTTRKAPLQLVEVEIELNFDAELAGKEEKDFSGNGKGTIRRYAVDRRFVTRHGIAFKKLCTVHGPTGRPNLTIRMTFVLGEED